MKISKLSKSSYYYSIKHLDFDSKNTNIIDKIKTIYDANKGRYGYRRITLELKIQGITVNHKKVKRIMLKLGLFSLQQKKDNKYNSYKGQKGRIADNLLLNEVKRNNNTKTYRNFKADKPNEKWGTDVSMFKIKYGKLYLSPIIDMYDSSIVSFNISTDPIFMQIQDMLDKAFNKYDDLNGLILHSDQGWQYQQKRTN